MELLSSFAINFAAGIALNLWENRANGVDVQIKSAFSAALKDWSKNTTVKAQSKQRFESILRDYIRNSDGTVHTNTNKDILDFFNHFEKRIAEKHAAFNYLQAINDKNRYDEITNQISEIAEKLSELIDSAHIDPRDVEELLNKMPFTRGKEAVENTLLEWYQQKTISLPIKELLFVAVRKVYDRTAELSEEIRHLKSKGDTYLAATLEKIKIAVESRKPVDLLKIYENHQTKEKENKIALLNELIKSSTTLFAYQEAIQFYSELIHIEPSAKNHFNFAYFLQKFNFFDEAIRLYQKALKIIRALSEENQKTYLPNVATTLNNLANLHSYKNELSKALENYQEALKIYRKLANKNSQTYLPYVATTLNNLANLQKTKNEFPKALENYQAALKIYGVLAKENSQTYLPYVATTLNNLAILQKDKNEFPRALDNYQEALKIRRVLAKENPQTYLPDVATTLNNLASLQYVKNEFPKALKNYQEALKIRRDLAKKSPLTYLPHLATTLNNLAAFHSDNNEIPKALENFLEALNIYKAFAKENPQIYLPDVAMILTNLASLQMAKNEFPKGLENYQEALEIRRILAKENPQRFEIEYANSLIMGVVLFKMNNNLKEAREILDNYTDIYEAQKLLKIINDLEANN